MSTRNPARTSAWSSATTTRITGDLRRAASRAATRNPPPARGAALNSPPKTATRSRMPISPWPGVTSRWPRSLFDESSLVTSTVTSWSE